MNGREVGGQVPPPYFDSPACVGYYDKIPPPPEQRGIGSASLLSIRIGGIATRFFLSLSLFPAQLSRVPAPLKLVDCLITIYFAHKWCHKQPHTPCRNLSAQIEKFNTWRSQKFSCSLGTPPCINHAQASGYPTNHQVKLYDLGEAARRSFFPGFGDLAKHPSSNGFSVGK